MVQVAVWITVLLVENWERLSFYWRVGLARFWRHFSCDFRGSANLGGYQWMVCDVYSCGLGDSTFDDKGMVRDFDLNWTRWRPDFRSPHREISIVVVIKTFLSWRLVEIFSHRCRLDLSEGSLFLLKSCQSLRRLHFSELNRPVNQSNEVFFAITHVCPLINCFLALGVLHIGFWRLLRAVADN
jgi:hypothetical protein